MQEQYENQEEGQIDLLEIIHVMLRKWWLIVLCGIIGAGALGVYTKFFVTPQYSASSTIYILSSTTNVSGSGISLSLSEQLTADFLLLAKSRPVLEEAAEKVGDGVTSEMLAGSVVIENPTGSHMLKVTATNEDAQLAKDIDGGCSCKAGGESHGYRSTESDGKRSEAGGACKSEPK